MPKNLRSKIGHILEDCETLPKYELLDRLERLVNEELRFLDAEHAIDSIDLALINSQAIKNYTDRSLAPEALGKLWADGTSTRTLCLVEAAVAFLRGRGLVNFKVVYNKK